VGYEIYGCKRGNGYIDDELRRARKEVRCRRNLYVDCNMLVDLTFGAYIDEFRARAFSLVRSDTVQPSHNWRIKIILRARRNHATHENLLNKIGGSDALQGKRDSTINDSLFMVKGCAVARWWKGGGGN
jgi:hypothetical protein